jgi:elongator complex protein 3
MLQKLEIIDRILKSLDEHPEIDSKEKFQIFKNNIYREYKLAKVIPAIAFIERYNDFIAKGEMKYDIRIHKLLRKRAIRSLSGVSVISLLTKFWGCPGKCIYCPTNENLPKSYIPNEPAVMRAELNAFDPVRQVQNRLRSLEITGHTIDKCDVRVIGGTWSFYPRPYQEEFIKGIYDAHSNYSLLHGHIAATSIEAEKFASFRLEE